LATVPGNRSEAEDAFMFARLVESGPLYRGAGRGGGILLLKRRRGGLSPLHDEGSGRELRAARLSIGAWLAVNVVLTLWFEAGAPEPWSMSLLPFWLLMGLVMIGLAAIAAADTNDVTVVWRGGVDVTQFVEVISSLDVTGETWQSVHTGQPPTGVTNQHTASDGGGRTRFFRIRTVR